MNGDWGIQAVVSVNDTVPANIKPGILQHPVFTENMNVILAADKAVRNISGTIQIDTGAETPLTFTSDGNPSNDNIQVAPYTLSSTDTFSIKIKVSGTNAYGFVGDVDSLTVSVSRVTLSMESGLTSQDGKSRVHLPAYSLKKDTYLTLYKQEEADLLIPDPNMESRPLTARYLLGLGGVELDQPGILSISVSPPRYPEKTGIARLENGTWRYLGGGYENGVYILPITKLGIYQVREFSEIQKVIPEKYGLTQNYPNPFNPTTRIDYDLPEAGLITLRIYNILGQEIRTLVTEFQPAGSYQVFWDGKNQFGHTVASGIYFYQIRASQYVKIKKMVYAR